MSNPQYPTRLPCGSRVLDLARPHVMGILNVTPDSFSDGGRYDRLDDALRHAERMVREGATLIDVGGESTRPGARSVSPTEEL
ncbi:dihydropteroate synthase, partial [Pseudomonas aeruginosa]